MSLQRRLPKVGFRSRKDRATDEIRLSELKHIVGEVVDLLALHASGLIGSGIQNVKIIASGTIDVAYTILALSEFYNTLKDSDYLCKMEVAFNWFLGRNHLNQIIYNPCTGGCYDGLEEHHINLNQGAESTVSYLLSRLTFEKHRHTPVKAKKYDRTFQLHVKSAQTDDPRKALSSDSFQDFSIILS